MNPPKRKRVTIKLKCPNPLFEKWLTEWRDEARMNESKMECCFSNALASIRKFPLPLETGKDCKVLKGFGDKLCKMLDNKLNEYKLTGGNIDLLEDATSSMSNNFSENVINKQPIKKKKSPQLNKLNNCLTNNTEYVPHYRSGPYAIMISIYTLSLQPNYPGYSHKTDIIKKGEHLCDTSFTKPDPGTRYTAWSSMKTLLNKELILKCSNPPKFSLTDKGIVLAHKLLRENNNSENEGTNDNKSTSELSQQQSPKKHSAADFVVNSKYSSLLNIDFDNIITVPKLPTDNQVRMLGKNLLSSDSTKETSSTIKSFTNINVTDQSKKFDSMIKTNSTKNTTSNKNIYKKTSSKSKSTMKSNETVSDGSEETVFLPAYTFDIILLVDTQETSGKANQCDDPIISELTHMNANFEVRHLKVGDYTWICRERTSGFELVLPYIIERKRMDDLGSSIKDGRFHEQKFRLKQCGIENIIYLVESYGKDNQHLGLPVSTIYQAATNTLVQDGFTLKFTDNLTRTAEYLVCLTSLLKNNFENKTLMSCPKENLVKNSLEDDLISLMVFKEFNKSATKSKKFKVKDHFIKQLLQIKGMSVDRAVAIVEKYPTPKCLKLVYEETPTPQREKLLSSITFGKLKKNIGIILSKIVYQLFNNNQF